MTTLDQFVHESLLNNVSLEKHNSSDVSVVDVAQKFDWNIAQSRKAMYDYYTAEGQKMSEKLTFNMMCVYTEEKEIGEGQHSHIKNFKLIKSLKDEKFILEQVAPENIIDMFVYSIGLKQHGASEGEDALIAASLKPVQKVFVSHGRKLDLSENAVVQDKKSTGSKPTINSTADITKRSATEPAKSFEKRKVTSVADIRAAGAASASGAGTSKAKGSDVNARLNTNSSSSSTPPTKASSFMGLRSMDFLAKRKEQDELKEQQRLKELREKRAGTTTAKNTLSNTQSVAKKPKIDVEKQKKLKELESMFSDSDEGEDNEVEALSTTNSNKIEISKDTRAQTDLAEVENLFDTTNDDSEMVELLTKEKPQQQQQQAEEVPPVKRSSPLKKPTTYVDEEGYIVSTNLNANKRPAKRTASTLPIVSSTKTGGSSDTANKKRKQGNLMNFFSKRK
ncbi:hypothetical protein ACO0QE_003907 [Hanseniaspora vineae]